MPRKKRASKACVRNVQGARDVLSGKRQKSTTTESDRDDERKSSGDEIVHLTLFKTHQSS